MNEAMNNPPFVKKFDFRGVYGKDIKDEDAFYLGLALCLVLKPKKILLGWDTRVSSKTLALNFIQAIKNFDVEILYLDKVPIDYVTVASVTSDFDLSIMFTGSHNTWEWSGLLIHTKGGFSLQGELVEEVVKVYYDSQITPYEKPSVELSTYINFQEALEKIYIEKIQNLIPLHEIKAQSVVVDIGDGSGGKALDLVEKLLPQVIFTRLNDRRIYDSNTPHTADPSEPENAQQIIKHMKNKDFTSGFIYDSDADRVLAIDERGDILNGSVLAGGMSACFKMLGISSDRIGYAVECGPSLYNAVKDVNKTVNLPISLIPIPVGRSVVRQLLFDGKIDVGVENVGHFYIKDFFMTDSATFVMLLILYWISMNGKLSGMLDKHPDGLRQQFSVPLLTNDNHLYIMSEDVSTIFKDLEMKKITVDGLRLEAYKGEYMNSWCAIRKSGYEQVEKRYYGSTDPNIFNALGGVLLKKD